MPDIISINTPQWKLTVWCKKISSRVQQYKSMLANRDLISPEKYSVINSKQELLIDSLHSEIEDATLFQEINNKHTIYSVTPLFFENLVYDFEFEFKANRGHRKEDIPFISNGLKLIDEAFRYKVNNEIGVLRGSINTGNNIGTLNLPLTYYFDNKLEKIDFAFEVIPVKMSLHTDIPDMYKTIDQELPLWRFALSEISNTSFNRVQGSSNFPLLWLRQFEALRQDLNKGIKIVLNSPHSRLYKKNERIRPERIKGKISRKLEEKITLDLNSNRYDKKYIVNRKYLNIDTPENRFIKFVLKVIYQKLVHIEHLASEYDKGLENNRLTDIFFVQINSWKKPLKKFSENPIFRDIGEFSGFSSESLVLQQKSGYSKVYRSWQQLKFYLSSISGDVSISSKSINNLYEIWCFLEIKNILINNLNFKELTTSKTLFNEKGLELSLKDGIGHAFKFIRNDGVSVRLAHEPVFNKSGRNLKVYSISQVPDILLEVTYKDGASLIWVFDAKYRIEKNKVKSGEPQVDLVPDDAINQMHRYRDSIIHEEYTAQNEPLLSRPIMGAFALYPGVFDQLNNEVVNPYNESILKVGIGAFPILPSQKNGEHNKWLIQFLKDRLESSQELQTINEKIVFEPNSHIPVKGMNMILKI